MAKTKFAIANSQDPYLNIASRCESDKYWRWGDDNLLPNALALMSRRSTTHRRIINDKADYISGRGFNVNEEQIKISSLINRCNSDGESLRRVLNKLAYDKALFGNAFLEIVTDASRSFLSLYHRDASQCRVAKDSQHIIMHHDWSLFKESDAETIALYPSFEECEDGSMRSMLHYKDYEPLFTHYGVPAYVAGMGVSAIAYKTYQWNISRLDNSFQ
ncbi:MAG: phage portal protein, partial [Rikenellaceae bacterium]